MTFLSKNSAYQKDMRNEIQNGHHTAILLHECHVLTMNPKNKRIGIRGTERIRLRCKVLYFDHRVPSHILEHNQVTGRHSLIKRIPAHPNVY